MFPRSACAAARRRSDAVAGQQCAQHMMNRGHIYAVFSAGKVRKWRGKPVGVDMGRVMRLATKARDSLWRRAGNAVEFMA